jgi:hypothetical protein
MRTTAQAVGKSGNQTSPKGAKDWAKDQFSRTRKKGCLRLLDSYNFLVARGWESKSVEDQQAQAASTPSPPKTPLTPDQIFSQRQKQGLLLSRQRVLQQLEAALSPRHREMLQSALADLDKQLAQLV